MGIIIFLVIGVIVCLIIVAATTDNSRKEKELLWKITDSDVLESNKFMQTDFYKKICSEIYQKNINVIKDSVKNGRKMSLYFRRIRANKDRIYFSQDDWYDNEIKFKSLGYNPLNDTRQVKILLYSLSKMQGYGNYEIVNYSREDVYGCISCDTAYWQNIYDKYKEQETNKLKNIF